MGFVVKIISQDISDIEGYYVGKLDYYSSENVVVPRHTNEINLAKAYKHRKNAENAIKKILKESSFVSKCDIEEF